ncbi:MAG: HD domain-containing protein [Calothrix sp. SM1_5_4]|nr:HD domain-containing protein [Calothrix sp. SM1_5_4]
MVLQSQMRDGPQLNLLALGCMLHDIEHYFTGLNIARPISQITGEDLITYRAHPINGAHRLSQATFVDQMVMNIIAQHEEHIDGSGLPKGLHEDDMDPLVLVAGVANAFDRLISFEDLPPKTALKALLIDKMGVYPLPCLQALQEVLKKQGLV